MKVIHSLRTRKSNVSCSSTVTMNPIHPSIRLAISINVSLNPFLEVIRLESTQATPHSSNQESSHIFRKEFLMHLQ